MKLNFISGDIHQEVMDMDRVEAIIVMNGKIYSSDGNHQGCLQDIINDVFTSKGWDINEDADLEKAIDYTDKAFMENRLFGFDIVEDLEHRYLIAHYPQNLENDDCYRLMVEFAFANELELATYTSRFKLGNEVRLVEMIEQD